MPSRLDRSTLITLCVLAAVCLPAASYWGYRGWQQRQQQARTRLEETLRQRCDKAMKDKNWSQLETSATAWLKLDRKNGFAWLYLGEAAQRQGDFERAAECLSALDEADPKCQPALLELVELQLGKFNRPLDAMETCRRIIKLNPLVAKAHQRLIFFYAMTLQRREMIREIRRTIDLNAAEPEAYAYLLLASSLRFSNGYQVNTHWLKSDPDNEYFQVARAVFLARGAAEQDKSISESNPSPAKPGFDRLLLECREKFPDNAEILAYLLEAEVEAGNADNVASLLATAPAAAELDSRFWRFKGWYHAAANDLEEAERAYRESLKWDPYDWRSRHQLAGVLRRQNKLDEVDALTELALEGKRLEQALLELPNTGEINVELAREIAEFSERIGDVQVASRIRASLDGPI